MKERIIETLDEKVKMIDEFHQRIHEGESELEIYSSFVENLRFAKDNFDKFAKYVRINELHYLTDEEKLEMLYSAHIVSNMLQKTLSACCIAKAKQKKQVYFERRKHDRKAEE